MLRKLARPLAAFIVIGLTPLFAEYQKPVPQQRAEPRKGRCDEGPVTRAGIMDNLESVKRERLASRNKTSLTANQLVNDIDKCGLDFQPSTEDLEAIRKVDPDRLLGAVERAGRQPIRGATPPPVIQPVEPPKPKQGRLSVVCKPVDCDVLINGKKIGSTKNGAFTSGPMPLGDYTVTVSTPEHAPDPGARTATIRHNETEKSEFVLKPTRPALEAAGQNLFTRMIGALGGEGSLGQTVLIKAAGKLTFNREGMPTTWSIVALMKLPDAAKITVTRIGQSLDCWKLESGFQCAKDPKDKADELYEGLGEFYDRQMGRTLDRLRAPGLKKLATKLNYPEGENPVVRVEGGADTYVITLESDLPKEIKVESKGFSDGLQMLFSDYEKIGGTSYPKSLIVLWPGTAKKALEARFDTVTFGPSAVNVKELAAPKKLRK